ncbi:copper resistance CopC family protein [Pengzhenrongella sicca]|uniref:Copper resistance protein CopC n=1 Tax=Pengzhenrongella sicca TaxID=2819238 RepID=A0A8A4ZGT0_9MICO|nr:copper resistance CopC family protein [Pengzhenrongella sicca]QTE30199.1 copper resistance protein CopC [Pengzhenrongella sicca]
MTELPSISARPGPFRARAMIAAAAGAAILALILFGAASPASAHDALVSATPADGSTVEAAPATVDLVFAEPAVALGTEIVVLGPDGATVSTGAVVLTDATVSQALVADRPAGTYTVQYRVTSADGHPVSGQLTFVATGAVAAPAAPDVVAPTGAPSGEQVEVAPSAAPSSLVPTSPAGTSAASSSDAEDDAARDAQDGAGSPLPWVLAAAAVALAAAGWRVWRTRQGG